MFHANAWCFPFSCTLVGAKQVFPGPHLDPESLLDAFVSERVTLSAGVPTIWMGILQALDANPGGWDLSAMRTMTVGGSAPPRAMIEAFGERHGLHLTHGVGHDRDVADGDDLGPAGTGARPRQGGRVRQARAAGPADPVRRDPRARRGGARAVGRREHGRARGARPVDLVGLLRRARGGRPVDGRRLVPHRRHRHDRPRRVRRGAGPREGPRQVGRRVDLDGRARERADGAPGGGGGGGDRGARREVGGAAARGRRPA